MIPFPATRPLNAAALTDPENYELKLLSHELPGSKCNHDVGYLVINEQA